MNYFFLTQLFLLDILTVYFTNANLICYKFDGLVFDKARAGEESECRSCYISTTYTDGQADRVVHGCVGLDRDCQPDVQEDNGVRIFSIECCHSDRCNGDEPIKSDQKNSDVLSLYDVSTKKPINYEPKNQEPLMYNQNLPRIPTTSSYKPYSTEFPYKSPPRVWTESPPKVWTESPSKDWTDLSLKPKTDSQDIRQNSDTRYPDYGRKPQTTSAYPNSKRKENSNQGLAERIKQNELENSNIFLAKTSISVMASSLVLSLIARLI